jgi:integrase
MQEWAGEVAAGRNPLQERRLHREALSFREFVERVYLKSERWARKAPATQAGDLARIKNYLLPALGHRKLIDISLADLTALSRDLNSPAAAAALARRGGATKKTARGGEGGARRTMRLAKAILSYAVEAHELAESPAARLKVGQDGRRTARPDTAAYERLAAALTRLRGESPTMRLACDVVRLLALTGARKSEVLRLRWRHVDLERGRIVIPPAEHKSGRKTQEPRVIALSDAAKTVLLAYQPGEPEAFVFAGARGVPVALQRPWARIAKAAELPAEITLHTLRHGVGSLLAGAGASPVEIATALGHRDWRTSQIYCHASQDDHARLARRVSDLVGSVSKLRAVG